MHDPADPPRLTLQNWKDMRETACPNGAAVMRAESAGRMWKLFEPKTRCPFIAVCDREER